MKLYIDSSVWSYLFADHMPYQQTVTKRFLESSEGQHDLFISPLVLYELNATPDEGRRRKLLQAVNDAEPTKLLQDSRVEAVSGKLIDLGILTARSEGDAAHIATAIVWGMDALVSWDTRHIVRLKTKRGASAVCRLLGYPALELVTPAEV